MAKGNGSFFNPVKIPQLIWRLIPSFSRLGLITRISLTILLAGICMNLFYAKINPALPLLKGALTFSPQKYAEELIAKDHLKTAEEYINFYSQIPGVTLSNEMRELAEKAHAGRSGMAGVMHQGKHAIRGITGEESDELIATAVDATADFTSLGDVRDLYREYKNYSSGKEVDKLSAGLAAIGLTMTLGELAGSISGLVTGGTSTAGAVSFFEPVKKISLGIKKALKYMNPQLLKSTQKLFEPVFRRIANAKILDKIPVNLSKIKPGPWKEQLSGLMHMVNINQWKTYFKNNLNKISDIAQFTKDKVASLGDILTLGKKNPIATKVLVENATNVKTLDSLAGMVLKLGERSKEIFMFGGKYAMNAMETLGKRGKLSVQTLKEAMRVGANGLKAVALGCWPSLNRMLALCQKSTSLLWWFMGLCFFSKMPFWLVLLVELLGISILLKTWGFPWTKVWRKTA